MVQCVVPASRTGRFRSRSPLSDFARPFFQKLYSPDDLHPHNCTHGWVRRPLALCLLTLLGFAALESRCIFFILVPRTQPRTRCRQAELRRPKHGRAADSDHRRAVSRVRANLPKQLAVELEVALQRSLQSSADAFAAALLQLRVFDGACCVSARYAQQMVNVVIFRERGVSPTTTTTTVSYFCG